MKIIQSTLLTVPEEFDAPRTWAERLFSLPWRPWVTQKTVIRQVPRRDVLISEVNGMVIMHPATYAHLRQINAIPAGWL